MVAELLRGLLPDHLVLALMVLLLVLESLRVGTRWARPAFVVLVSLALLAVLGQILDRQTTVVVVAREILVDRLALLGKLVVLLCALALGVGFQVRRGHKFWFLTASSLYGAMLIMNSAGFVPLFLGIELLSLPAFALMVHEQGRGLATEGAFKYLVLSSVASALMLFGISLAYGATGSLAIDAYLQALAGGGALARAGTLLLLGGLLLKAAVFPLHAWAPDAYASTRLQVTALLASVLKAAVVLALVRIFGGVALDPATVVVVAALGVVSIFFGNLAALGQRRFRRLLAYSSVAHAGYMVFALADVTGQRPGDLLWYTAFYGLATVLACASFAVMCPGDDDDLQALDGQFARHPVAALLLAFALLSLAGVPPFPGFFAKLFVFRSVVASGQLGPAVLAFAGSFLGLAVYLGIVMRLFRSDGAARAGAAAA